MTKTSHDPLKTLLTTLNLKQVSWTDPHPDPYPTFKNTTTNYKKKEARSCTSKQAKSHNQYSPNT